MSFGKYDLMHLPGQLDGEIKTSVVTVSGGPTLVPSIRLENRKDFLIYNDSGATVYVGGSDVSFTNGIPVANGGSFGFQAGRVDVYVTVSGTNRTIRLMEIS
jgi:hypothetical protein